MSTFLVYRVQDVAAILGFIAAGLSFGFVAISLIRRRR